MKKPIEIAILAAALGGCAYHGRAKAPDSIEFKNFVATLHPCRMVYAALLIGHGSHPCAP